MSSTHAALPFWRRYIFSTDHKIIGLQYILTAAFMAVISVALSVLIRMQMAWPARLWPIMERLLPAAYEGGALKPEFYLTLVTMHGTIMVFFVISLALVSGMRIIDMPLVRRLRMVVTKFRPPMVKETMNRAIPRSQRVWPIPDPGRAPGSAERGG